MKYLTSTTSTPAKKPATVLSLFKKSQKPTPSPSSEHQVRAPPSPTHSTSSSSETLDIQFSFDLHSAPFSTYIPTSEPESAPPAYSPAFCVATGKEEDLEVIEKRIKMDGKELKRQKKAMKLLEEDRRMSEGLKGLGL